MAALAPWVPVRSKGTIKDVLLCPLAILSKPTFKTLTLSPVCNFRPREEQGQALISSLW